MSESELERRLKGYIVMRSQLCMQVAFLATIGGALDNFIENFGDEIPIHFDHKTLHKLLHDCMTEVAKVDEGLQNSFKIGKS